jgi:glycolate oxidase iron-sulfur subunit
MACPQGVRNDLITMAARDELVKHNGLPASWSMAFRHVMKSKDTMKRALSLASRFQRLLPVTKKTKRGSVRLTADQAGTTRHVPNSFPGADAGRQIPSIAGSFLSDMMPEVNPPFPISEPSKLRVAYFAGCATEFVFPHVGKALIGMLNRSGIEVLFPKDQGCCGTPARASGDVETARNMAIRNLEVFAGLKPEVIVTGCATCGSALKETWESLVPDNAGKSTARELAGKVRDVSEFIVQQAGFKPLRYRSLLPENVKVTYHDPCHLARHQSITEEPRKILKQAFGDRFIEMDNNGCCGFGGSFNLKDYDLSRKIGKDKIESIRRTGADVVVTTCPGCMIQLVDGIERNRMPQRVIHLANAVEPS